MLKIAREMKKKHDLVAVAITHRLGRVDIGEESVLIAISSGHRQAAWRAGEECLELVKAKVEIWKEEWFEDGGVWRANRDGQAGVPVAKDHVDSVKSELAGHSRTTSLHVEEQSESDTRREQSGDGLRVDETDAARWGRTGEFGDR